MQWHWVDLIIVSIVVLSMLTGLFRGFVKEMIALCTWGLALWLAFHYTLDMDSYLSPYLHDQKIRKIASFVLIILLTLLAGSIVNATLSFILKRAGLSGTDRTLGMGFGFIRGVFIVALIILAVRMTSLPTEDYAKDSRFYAKFDPLVNMMYGYMPQFIKQVKTLEPDDHTVKSADADIVLKNARMV